jgi:DNA polymerase
MEQHAAAGSLGLPCDEPLDALLPVGGLPAAPRRAAAPSMAQPSAPAHAPVAHEGHRPAEAPTARAAPSFGAPPSHAPATAHDPRTSEPRVTAAATNGPTARAAPAAALGEEERRARLAVLADEARDCRKCVLCEQRKQAVFARGNPMAEVCFVGEGPGADEDAQGEPFVGKAGQLLDRMIAGMGYRPDDVYICNIVKCRPPNNRKPEPAEMAACLPFVTQQIAIVRPRVLVALGATAVQGLLGTTEGITRLRGKWKLYKGATPVMPTFHPAYVLRQDSARRDVWNDLKEILRYLGKTPPPPTAQRR